VTGSRPIAFHAYCSQSRLYSLSVANLVRKFVYRNGKTVRLLIVFDEMEKNDIQKLVRSKSERVTFEANSGKITSEVWQRFIRGRSKPTTTHSGVWRFIIRQ
jgi:uncharacterized protein (UPF0218 family)